MKNRSLFVCACLFCLGLQSQSLIESGPMNGYAEMREVMVWVQMKEACIVELVYWPLGEPTKDFRSLPVAADPTMALAVHLLADSVQPGIEYGYAIYANGQMQSGERELHFKTPDLWRWRTDPPAFSIALGSCSYINEARYDRPGSTYGSDYSIYERIADQSPDIMLWLGDNTYLREADWFTRTGILERHSHTRKTTEMQRLLTTGSHYAIWDDHDYGPNDANRTFPHKDLTLEAFKLFWANNGYGVSNSGGITSAFQYQDIHFYLLDNRWNRTDANLATTEEQVLGEAQIDWLIESLAYSRAPFKFVAVGGQVLNDAKVYETYANYETERQRLLDRIAAEKIEGVIFLTGDRHHTELSKVVHKGTTIYDLTVSPLTAGTHKPGDEVNNNRVEGTLVHDHNFALLDVSGAFNERKLSIKVIGVDGEVIWQQEIDHSEWTKKEHQE